MNQKEELSRTSKEWQIIMPEITVIDPDGWDRKNYEYSWNQEIITRAEYIKRRTNSTCYGFENATKTYTEKDLRDALEYGLDYGYNQGFADATNESAYEDLDTEEIFNDYKKQL